MQEPDDIAHRIGARFREGRRRKHLTLEELGKATGLSSAFLSRLERGETSTSIANLIRIAGAIGVSLQDVFETEPANPAPRYVLSKGEARKAQTLLSGPGHGYQRLRGPLLGQHLEAFELEYPVDERQEIPFSVHEGEEVLYLLSGRLEFQVGADRFVMEQGDFVHLQGSQPHRGRNIGAEPARMLMVVSQAPGGAHSLGRQASAAEPERLNRRVAEEINARQRSSEHQDRKKELASSGLTRGPSKGRSTKNTGTGGRRGAGPSDQVRGRQKKTTRL